VSVTGTNFDTTAPNDRVKVNATLGTVSSVTTTSFGTTTPAATGYGPITIATPLGTARRAPDLFIPPRRGTSDVAYQPARHGCERPHHRTANRIGLVTFAGTAGQRFSLVASSGTFGGAGGCNLHLSVLKPNSSVLSPAACMGTTGFIDGTALPVTGTYTMLLEPGSTTGSVTLALYDASDATGTITAGGSAVTASTSIPGQNVALTFSGTSGQRVSVLGASASFTNLTFGCEAVVRIRKADGSALSGDACVEFGGFLDTVTLPATGSYAVVLDPASTATGSVSPRSVACRLSLRHDHDRRVGDDDDRDGRAERRADVQRHVQPADLAARDERVVYQSDIRLRADRSIKKLDGSTLGCDVCMEFGGFIDATTLPATGTYTSSSTQGARHRKR
jgi:hypothetical protein